MNVGPGEEPNQIDLEPALEPLDEPLLPDLCSPHTALARPRLHREGVFGWAV
jgi:hypothetical protein